MLLFGALGATAAAPQSHACAQQLANVADVTMEVNAGTAANAPQVQQQMTDLLVNNSISVRPWPPCISSFHVCSGIPCTPVQ